LIKLNKMKKLLLFMVTLMLFFLYLVPIIWSFKSAYFSPEAVASALAFWYIMIFILTLRWGTIVESRGCWFFS